MSQVWSAEIRKDEGKGASRRLRHANKIPAIIYGAGQKPKSVALALNFVKRMLMDEALYNSVLTLDVEGTNETCIIKDLQRHPATGEISHIDFQRTDDTAYIVKRVPFAFEGTDVAPGVKLGGLMSFMQTDVEIKCLAKNLPSAIKVDVSKMEAGSNMRLSELTMPEGVTIIALSHGNSDYDQSVVGISKVRV